MSRSHSYKNVTFGTGTCVSFLLQVADADEARGKLQMRQVHCNPAEIVLSLQVMTVRDRTVNAAIGAVIQNVEILSPSSLGQRHAGQSTALLFILPIFLFRRSRASRCLRRRWATSPRQNSKGACNCIYRASALHTSTPSSALRVRLTHAPADNWRIKSNTRP